MLYYDLYLDLTVSGSTVRAADTSYTVHRGGVELVTLVVGELAPKVS